MEETEVCLCYHVTPILSETCNFQCRPNRITGEELVVGRNSRELHHAEFHGHMVDQLLCLGLGKCTFLEVTVYVDIDKGRDTSNAHSCAVLSLNSGKIAEIKPLDCLFCVCCRSGNVIAVDLCHLFHAL